MDEKMKTFQDSLIVDIPEPTLHPIFLKGLRKHQVEGFRFLWQEVVENQRGALLAHTMGLGKTVQIISFLFTLAQVRTSSILGLVPETLADDRTLILLPAGLLANWLQEFQSWSEKFSREERKLFGPLYPIGRYVERDDRIELLQEWTNSGGICLMGYELFRNYLKPDRIFSFSEEEMEIIDEALHDPGPTLVIADEV